MGIYITQHIKDPVKAITGKEPTNLEDAQQLIEKFCEENGCPPIGFDLIDLIEIAVQLAPGNIKRLLTPDFYREIKSFHTPSHIIKDQFDVAKDHVEHFELKLRQNTQVREGKQAVSLLIGSIDEKLVDSHFAPVYDLLDTFDDIKYYQDKTGFTVRYKDFVILRYFRPSMLKGSGKIYGILRFMKYRTTNLVTTYVPKRFWEGKTVDLIRVHTKINAAQIKYIELQELCDLLAYFKDQMTLLHDTVNRTES